MTTTHTGIVEPTSYSGGWSPIAYFDGGELRRVVFENGNPPGIVAGACVSFQIAKEEPWWARNVKVFGDSNACAKLQIELLSTRIHMTPIAKKRLGAFVVDKSSTVGAIEDALSDLEQNARKSGDRIDVELLRRLDIA